VIDKDTFRQQCLAYRKKLDNTSYFNYSKKIIETLNREVNLSDFDTIHCYAAITKNKEVNTHPLLKTLLEQGINVVLPVSDFENIEMKNILIRDLKNVKENKWGILEPTSGPEIDNKQIELAIVPMVGGDPKCNRIGYGKGFYDRFLANVDAPKIGLCYQRCVAAEPVETNKHDIPLDMVITEKEHYLRTSSVH